MRKMHNGTHILEKAQDLYSNSMEKAQDLYSDSRKIAKSGATKANTFVHDRPVLSTLLGAGAGFLIGWLIRRST